MAVSVLLFSTNLLFWGGGGKAGRQGRGGGDRILYGSLIYRAESIPESLGSTRMRSTTLIISHFLLLLLCCFLLFSRSSCSSTSLEMRFAAVWSLVFLSCHLVVFAKKKATRADDIIMCTTRCNVKKKARTRTCATVCQPKSASVVTITDSKYDNYKHRIKKLEAKRKKLEKIEKQKKLENSLLRGNTKWQGTKLT